MNIFPQPQFEELNTIIWDDLPPYTQVDVNGVLNFSVSGYCLATIGEEFISSASPYPVGFCAITFPNIGSYSITLTADGYEPFSYQFEVV